MIDCQEASAALNEVDVIARRVRQSVIYQTASLMLILWGAIVAAGNVLWFLSPRTALTTWLVLDGVGVLGWMAIAILQRARSRVVAFDLRMLTAFTLFFLFGILTGMLGHFGSRELGAFWATYVMLAYGMAGLWFGYAFVAIAIGVTVLTLIGYYFIATGFPLWMALINGGGLVLGGLWMRRS